LSPAELNMALGGSSPPTSNVNIGSIAGANTA
jgi:hypothetical protein